jgi:hypothetical protein
MIPTFNLDIYQFKRRNKMKELTDGVKNGKVIPGSGIYVIGNIQLYDTFIAPVLSEYQQTVCVAYPDEKKAWIIEGRSVENAYGDEQKQKLVDLLNSAQLHHFSDDNANSHALNNKPYSFTQDTVNPYLVLDFNHDGKDDLFHFYRGTLIAYSVGDKYYGMELKDWTNQATSSIESDYFPHAKKTCEIRLNPAVHFLTTDGNNYYLNDQCNLTELTSLPSSK